MCSLLYLSLCVAFLTTYLPSASCIRTRRAYNFGMSLVEGYLSATRNKRAAAQTGYAIVKYVMQGAKRIYQSMYDAVYIQRGGNRRALRDFTSLKPAQIQEYREGDKITKIGTVGNRLVTVTTGDKFSRPSLSIQKEIPYPRKRKFIDTILYYE